MSPFPRTAIKGQIETQEELFLLTKENTVKTSESQQLDIQLDRAYAHILSSRIETPAWAWNKSFKIPDYKRREMLPNHCRRCC